jgi:hypothetical protein
MLEAARDSIRSLMVLMVLTSSINNGTVIIITIISHMKMKTACMGLMTKIIKTINKWITLAQTSAAMQCPSSHHRHKTLNMKIDTPIITILLSRMLPLEPVLSSIQPTLSKPKAPISPKIQTNSKKTNSPFIKTTILVIALFLLTITTTKMMPYTMASKLTQINNNNSLFLQITTILHPKMQPTKTTLSL